MHEIATVNRAGIFINWAIRVGLGNPAQHWDRAKLLDKGEHLAHTRSCVRVAIVSASGSALCISTDAVTSCGARFPWAM